MRNWWTRSAISWTAALPPPSILLKLSHKNHSTATLIALLGAKVKIYSKFDSFYFQSLLLSLHYCFWVVWFYRWDISLFNSATINSYKIFYFYLCLFSCTIIFFWFVYCIPINPFHHSMLRWIDWLVCWLFVWTIHSYYCWFSGTALLSAITSLPRTVDEHYESFNFYKGIDAIMTVLRDTNALVQNTAPWTLVKSRDASDQERLQHLLFLALEALRVCGVLIAPITPRLSRVLLEKLSHVPPEELLNLDNFSMASSGVAMQERMFSKEKVTLFERIGVETNVKREKGKAAAWNSVCSFPKYFWCVFCDTSLFRLIAPLLHSKTLTWKFFLIGLVSLFFLVQFD